MKRFVVVGVLSLVALSALLPESASRAGDVIDYLPEVVTARSFSVVYISGLLYPSFSVFPDSRSCLFNGWPSELPNHFLFDDDGNFHSASQLIELINNVRCNFFVVNGESNSISEGESILSSFQALKGEPVELSNGNILDGTKQSVRVVSLLAGAVAAGTLLLADEPVSEITGSMSNCEFFKQLASTGETIELRFAAFFVLQGDVALLIEENVGGDCISELHESTDQLVELTKSGDVEAAANLAYRLINQVGNQFEVNANQLDEETEIEELQALIDATLTELGIEILESTERFPLLTMAIAMSTLQVHSLDFLIQLFEEFDLIGKPIDE